MARKQIELTMSGMDVIKTMAEGNPGGLTVMMEILKTQGAEQGTMTLLRLDDMNIRGSQIWVGFKDHCGQDLHKFLEEIEARSPEMVDTINRECYHPNLVAEHGEIYGERARVDRFSG